MKPVAVSEVNNIKCLTNKNSAAHWRQDVNTNTSTKTKQPSHFNSVSYRQKYKHGKLWPSFTKPSEWSFCVCAGGENTHIRLINSVGSVSGIPDNVTSITRHQFIICVTGFRIRTSDQDDVSVYNITTDSLRVSRKMNYDLYKHYNFINTHVWCWCVYASHFLRVSLTWRIFPEECVHHCAVNLYSIPLAFHQTSWHETLHKPVGYLLQSTNTHKPLHNRSNRSFYWTLTRAPSLS